MCVCVFLWVRVWSWTININFITLHIYPLQIQNHVQAIGAPTSMNYLIIRQALYSHVNGLYIHNRGRVVCRSGGRVHFLGRGVFLPPRLGIRRRGGNSTLWASSFGSRDISARGVNFINLRARSKKGGKMKKRRKEDKKQKKKMLKWVVFFFLLFWVCRWCFSGAPRFDDDGDVTGCISAILRFMTKWGHYSAPCAALERLHNERGILQFISQYRRQFIKEACTANTAWNCYVVCLDLNW